jgi:IclR family acetate operon transcriptional repressor
LGKVLLGCSSETVHEDYDRTRVANGSLASLTPATIVDSQKLFDQIRSAAVQGYALDVEECEPGLTCAAAPVFGGEREVVAAVSVSAPAFRMSEERLLGEIVPLVVDAAARLSRELGFASPAN